MKAGIYKRRDNGKHLYVAKDRSIRAIESSNGRIIGDVCEKVSSQQKEQVVTFYGWTADRVADVPNGCNAPVKALLEYIESLPKTVSDPTDSSCRVVLVIGELPRKTMKIGSPTKIVADLERAERLYPQQIGRAKRIPKDLRYYRTCRSRKSAAKHRRAGHTVRKITNNLYVWSN